MVEFEWAIETPLPTLHVGAKFIINEDSFGENTENHFKPHEHIIFVVDSFGIGCISSEFSGDNIGKEVINFEILENTQDFIGQYKVGYFGEIQIDRAQELIDQGWWNRIYEEDI